MDTRDATPERLDGDSDASAPDMKDPRAVLSVLEADQIVAAKQRTHFGRRELSRGVRILLWGLRVYVVIMLVLVVISAFRVIHSGP
ncbi:MAG: hypothetical protein ACRD5K_08605 [Candidatus Acidiferrales bacterium]